MKDTLSLNLLRLIDRFPTEDKCREFLENLRWPKGKIRCPRCKETSLCEIPDRDQWDCLSCRYQFSVTAGTIMHDSHLSLRKWFVSIYLMVESRKGISANQLKRILGVSYKTAWYLCHRIRSAMGPNETTGPTLFGVVEVDETLRRPTALGSGQVWKDLGCRSHPARRECAGRAHPQYQEAHPA